MKIHKKKKSVRLRGTNSGGHGSRKKWKGSGHRGGKGMAGTGKRADQKKSLVIKKYGNKYFGKQGITSKGTAVSKLKVINLGQIQKNHLNLMKKFGKNGVLVLEKYKVLGNGVLKEKLKIKAKDFSERAKAGIKKAGGEVVEEKRAEVKEKAEVKKSKEEVEVKKESKGVGKKTE